MAPSDHPTYVHRAPGAAGEICSAHPESFTALRVKPILVSGTQSMWERSADSVLVLECHHEAISSDESLEQRLLHLPMNGSSGCLFYKGRRAFWVIADLFVVG